MKISYEKIQNENRYVTQKCVYKFKIVSSVLKKHYKELARMAMLFNSQERNAGYIKKEDEQAFLKLVGEIENSNDKRCVTSHEKAVAKVKTRKSTARCEHEDLASLGYTHGSTVKCPHCGQAAQVW
jgi:hypothetical protein